MRRLALLMGLTMVLVLNAVAHTQRTHQYMVREAMSMLQSQGFNLPAISTHLGYDQGSSTGELTDPWIVAGAYNEDEADHVYHHGTPLTPFDMWFKPFTSVTHFWRIPSDQLHSYDAAYSDLGYVGSVENAYMKTCKFRDGGWFFWVRWEPELWSRYRYYSLFDLYVNRRVYWEKDANTLGQEFYHNCDVYLTREQADAITFNILGRMAHLLGDMSVPAHVHSDVHLPIAGLWDWYEEDMDIEDHPSVVEVWYAGNVLNLKGGFINPYGNSDDPLHFLMYTMNQIADYFPSRNVDGNALYAPVGEIASTLAPFGPPISSSEYAQGGDNLWPTIYNIRDATMPYLIRATAGLIYWFAIESGMMDDVALTSPLIADGGSGGYYIVNGSNVTNFPFHQVYYSGVSVQAMAPAGCHFWKWSDGSTQNPRIGFYGYSVSAIFKHSMASSEADATGPANQRKLVRQNSTTYDLAYRSGGTIWRTRTTNSGNSWADEECWGKGGIAGNPALAATGSYGDLFAVWQETDGQGVKHLRYRGFDGYHTRELELDSDNGILDLQPAIAVSADEGYVLVMYKKLVAGANRMYYRLSEDGGWTFNGPTALTVGTPIDWASPSVAWNEQRSSFIIACASSGGYVNYLTFDGCTWSSCSVAAANGLSSGPQVAVDGTGREYFTWVALGSWSEPAAFARSRSIGGSWSTITEVNSDLAPPILHSSISGNSSQSGGGAFICNDTYVELTYCSTNGTSWVSTGMGGWPWYYGTYCISLLEKCTASAVASVVKTGTSAPYQIRFESRDFRPNGLQKTTGSNPIDNTVRPVTAYSRRLQYRETKGSGTLDVLLSDLHVSRESVNQDLPFASAESDWLGSQSLSLSDGKTIGGTVTIKGAKWNHPFSYSIKLEEATSGISLANLGTRTVPSLQDSTILVRISCGLPILQKLGDFRVVLTGLPTDAIAVDRIDVYKVGDSLRMAKAPPTSQGLSLIPATFDLKAAYPNPFNPTTTLEYHLPEDGYVQIVVFDQLGRKVQDLMSGFHAAGRHEVQWNAAGMSSGIYFARFMAMNDLGKVRFTKVNKLLLTK
jgi:hypothetical protein